MEDKEHPNNQDEQTEKEGQVSQIELTQTFIKAQIKKAEIEDLKKIPSIDERSARSVYNFFRSDTKDQDESLEKR